MLKNILGFRHSASIEEESTETLLQGNGDKEPLGSSGDTCLSCRKAHNNARHSDLIYKYILIVCLLCTSITCILTLVFPPAFTGTCTGDALLSVTRDQYHTLRRPSPFIGLDKVQRPVPPVHRYLINYPQTIAQIDASEKAKVFDDDPRRYMSRTGLVSPEERRVQVTKSVSTIVQFRAIDFGMEYCVLHLRLQGNESNQVNGERPSPFTLAVHKLEARQILDTKKLSYETRPKRVATMANIDIQPGHSASWTEELHCDWDEVLTFEISCFGDSNRVGFEPGINCGLEWWQDKESERPSTAVYMIQHASV